MIKTGVSGPAGCGFLDTVTMLIKLGADVNARDLTQCTPLQNVAHGTYSALATMPLNGSQGGESHIICLLPILLSTPLLGVKGLGWHTYIQDVSALTDLAALRLCTDSQTNSSRHRLLRVLTCCHCWCPQL